MSCTNVVSFWPIWARRSESMVLSHLTVMTLTMSLSKKVRTNDAASPKSTPNNNFLWIHCHLMNLIWVGVVSYMAIFFLNKPIHQKIRLKKIIWPKLGSSSKHSETQLANKQRSLCSFSLMYWVIWIYYWCRHNLPSYGPPTAELFGTGRIWLPRILLHSDVLGRSFDVQVLTDLGCFEFSQQMLEIRPGRTTMFPLNNYSFQVDTVQPSLRLFYSFTHTFLPNCPCSGF